MGCYSVKVIISNIKKQDHPFLGLKRDALLFGVQCQAISIQRPWQHFATQLRRSRTALYHHAEFGRMIWLDAMQ